MSQSIHQEVVFKSSPESVYEALTNSARFSQMTGGAPADISREEGGAFSCFGGHVEGRNIELVSGKRIVQAWRAKTWAKGVYSIARFELSKNGSETKLVFDHSGFPDGEMDHLASGWESNYWEPLRKASGQ